ncbi:hypothetical protein [Caulobacter sp. CCG-8]|uniref:hypothetical protein n=1 Tax=Caulobacter sp. CCG-8 TaxID=3127958 RepID=UPI00307CCE3E
MEPPMMPPVTPAPVQPAPAACVHRDGVQAVSFDALPAAIRANLRVLAPELSPAGGPFNASDVGAGPSTRFIGAVRNRDAYVVVYEHGGRGYHVDLLTYSANIADDIYAAPLARHVAFAKPDCADLDITVGLSLPRTPYRGPDW